jgi:prepilin-type N-terminal cleavage/methylation domain-containing protein
MREHASSARRAFTLVELLVVIAILSLLVSLVAPMIRLMFDFAQRSQCEQNLHAIQLGMVLYEQDRGCLPIHGTEYGDGYASNHWLFFGLTYKASAWPVKKGSLGYLNLGQLVGQNGDRASQLAGALPTQHRRYVTSPQTFYCPANTYGGTMTVLSDLGVSQYMQWEGSYETWPTSEDYKMSSWGAYSMRYSVNTKPQPPLEGESGLNIGPKAGETRTYVSARTFTIVDQGRVFNGHAVISDANGCGRYVPACHETGVNVAYRNGSVSFYEDSKGLLTTLNPINKHWSGSWPSNSPHSAHDVAQVAIWKDFDAKFAP